MGHQLAVGENLPGIQHPGLQKLGFGLRRQMLAIRQSPAIALRGKGDGEFQSANTALPVRGVENRDPDRAGEFRLPLPQLPAVEVNLPVRLDDPGNVGAVIRYDRLRGFLLGQSQLSS